MVLCLALQSIAAGPNAPVYTAIVYGGSETTVDDTVVINQMAAFPENSVQTHSDKTARLSFHGNELTLLGNSRVQLHTDSAELSGGVVVTTTTRFIIKSDCFTAQPAASGSSRYSVVPYQGRLYIHAEQGDVLVKAKRELHVPAGKTAAIIACGKPGQILEFTRDGDLIDKLVLGGAVAAGAATITNLPCQPVSAESPEKKCR